MGPSAEEEAAFLAEQPSGGSAPRPATPAPEAAVSEESLEPLPPLDELVKRIPMSARDLLDELFRAKFVTVKRVPTTALK